jgi:hypothetical protein
MARYRRSGAQTSLGAWGSVGYVDLLFAAHSTEETSCEDKGSCFWEEVERSEAHLVGR